MSSTGEFFNAVEADRRRRFWVAYAGIMASVIVVVAVSATVLVLIVVSQTRLVAAQNACFQVVQGNYYANIGLLADSNGRTLRGESADPAGNLARVQELRRASVFVAHLKEICYNDHPLDDPLSWTPPR